MQTGALRQIRIERYILAFLMVFLMVLIAQVSGEKEIIFPEIAALTIGGWIAEKQPWSVNKRKMFALMSLSALIGVLIVRYIPFGLPVQMCAGFIFTALALTLTKTTFVPIISACILPVFMGVTSWVYPISVTIMSLIIITAIWVMERKSMRPKNFYKPCEFDYYDEFKKWSKLLVLLLIISFLPLNSRYLFLIAPPLIVTYVEFANPKNPIRKKWLKIYLILCFAALLGTAASYILNLHLHLPLVIAASIVTVIMFFAFNSAHTLFPPSGAVMLLPLILPPHDLLLYPFEVAIGAFILINISRFTFPPKAKI